MKHVLFIMGVLFVALTAAQPVTITDSNGKVRFESTPERVVVINWTLTEQVLSLDVKPIGVAEVETYRQRIARPALAEGVVDVGSRIAPDLKAIAALEPDLILVGYSQRRLIRVLSNIAPVVYFRNFSRRYNNAEKADERFLELARLFNRVEVAENKLQQRELSLNALKTRLKAAYGSDEVPATTIMLIEEDQYAWTFGANSMPQYAVQRLGIAPAYLQEPSQFGVKKTSVSELTDVSGCILYMSFNGFDPYQSATWQNTQAMQSGCFYPLAVTSLYGGALSLQYLGQNIVNALLSGDGTVSQN